MRDGAEHGPSELAVVDRLAHALHRRVQPPLADHGERPVPPARAAPIIASQSSRDEASGFSTIAWAPVAKGGDGDGGVGGVRGGDDHGLDARADHLLDAREGPHPVLLGEGPRLRRVAPAHRHELGLRDRASASAWMWATLP